MMETQHKTLKPLLQHWKLTFEKVRHDLAITGSPERCLSRIVIEDKQRRLFILEEISPHNVKRKEEIAGILCSLALQGLPAVHPSLPNTSKKFITEHYNRFWTVRPYIEGATLQRPEYVYDGWRGSPAAAFLKELKAKSVFITDVRTPSFSIVAFIAEFLERVEKHNKELIHRITPFIEFLDTDFFAAHDKLPFCFCHGDYHPMNIVWSEDAILSVIDWEFSGYKPEIYDMSLLIGCIGMEDPAALTGPFVKHFLQGLAHACSPFSLRYIFEFVLALRFAWLSEWLRNKDKEMIELEIDYMALLLREKPFLKDAWARCLSA